MLVLDQFQTDAVSDIKSNNNVLVVAPTGSGKTLIAEKSIAVSYTHLTLPTKA